MNAAKQGLRQTRSYINSGKAFNIATLKCQSFCFIPQYKRLFFSLNSYVALSRWILPSQISESCRGRFPSYRFWIPPFLWDEEVHKISRNSIKMRHSQQFNFNSRSILFNVTVCDLGWVLIDLYRYWYWYYLSIQILSHTLYLSYSGAENKEVTV